MLKNVIIIKKDGTEEEYNPIKIIKAIGKSAERIMITLTDEDNGRIINRVEYEITAKGLTKVPISEMHKFVECALESVNPAVCKSYRDYRNYKKEFVHMLDDVYKKSQAIRYIGDKDNANTDSALVATKRSLIFNELNKELYRKFFMTTEELQACRDGYIYVHDQSARLDTMNCFAKETKFITKDGIKAFEEFNDGDKVEVISHKSFWRTAEVKCYGVQKLQKVIFERNTEKHEVYVTKNHKWLLHNGDITTDLKVGDVLCELSPIIGYGLLKEKPWSVKSIEETDREEEVWCLEVEIDHSFLLENRVPTCNCCLFNIAEVLKGGFEMGNVWYNEPKYLDTAFDVMGDIILSTAAQQYGGFTVPEADEVLSVFAEKSYEKYYNDYIEIQKKTLGAIGKSIKDLDSFEKGLLYENAEKHAYSRVRRDFEQGWQGIEYKLNTVGSSRGDYPFVTITIGLSTSRFGKMAAITLLNIHAKGQGKKGFEKPVLFPKIVFLYDKNLHGDGSEEFINGDVFNAGIACSAKTMYPDWLSLTGEGYVPSMYKKYGKAISPMGCRAFLSPWYERGGMHPADDDDKPIFLGRFNIGAVSLHLPMILAKAQRESKDFFTVLDYYLEMIRGLHKRTYAYLGEMRASTNPLAYCEGGFYGGHLKPSDKIKSILKPMTASFGITALNELQTLYNGKNIYEDGQFALDTLQYINKKVEEFKEADGWLYAIYGTPAESLCGLQIEQFRKMYGIIEGVSDRPYVSNSFHVPVWEDISPIEKQDSENRFWNLCNGGKIQYCRYPVDYNVDAIKSLVLRAMELGYYEGVNLSLAYCDDCGHRELEMDVCPKCGSKNLTKIDRMNGYLAYSRVHGDTRLNKAKMAEIADRKSM